MKENGLLLGKDFQAVTVSFDPAERPGLAAERRRGYLQSQGLSGSGEDWPFLVGPAGSSRHLADALGFYYKYDKASGEWAHMATIFVLTPDGRVSRYLYGIEFPPKDLRLALVEAGREGGDELRPVAPHLLPLRPGPRAGTCPTRSASVRAGALL